MCLFAPAPYYKLNKGFSLGFLFKLLGGLRPPFGLNKKASEKNPLSITGCQTVWSKVRNDFLRVLIWFKTEVTSSKKRSNA